MLFVLSAILGGGCAPATGPDVDAVTGYLDGLPAALHGDTLAGLRPYATEDELDRIRRYVNLMLYDGLRMEATLEDVRVTGTESSDGASWVETKEDWTIRYVDKDTGRLERSESFRIKARYHVVMADQAWVVSSMEEADRVSR